VRAFSATAFVIVGLAAVPAAAASPASPSPEVLTVHSSAYGRILFDRRGFALYAFTRDRGGRSACNASCAKAWPPYLVPERPRAGAGISRSLIGTISRRRGLLQATYRGRPLYRYVGDRRPFEVLCQNVREFGGVWLVVRPDGGLVR
jgi:predicted lipoprotein with Yx(FWY)xxD motif